MDKSKLIKVPQREKVTLLSFRNRFTNAEKNAIYSSDDVNVKIILDDLNAAEDIYPDDKQVVEGVKYLHEVGLITEDRAKEITPTIVI